MDHEAVQLASSATPGVFELGTVWGTLGVVWYRALLAAGLLVFACCAGWGISQSESLAVVRLVRWWIRRVVMPLLRSRSWLVRSVAIYVNNMVILSALVALGHWSWAVIAGTAFVGVVMGIAVRALSVIPELSDVSGRSGSEASGEDFLASWRVQWGMALNLLEPPAIVVALGLALSCEPESLSAGQVWGAFLVVVAPMMLVAACGESLWMGESEAFDAGVSSSGTGDGDPEQPDENLLG